jgi:hypothetical protein
LDKLFSCIVYLLRVDIEADDRHNDLVVKTLLTICPS